ncbi:NTF2-like protein [Dioscorea alata]|uniref:NTF2-like protein n=1 Tax=Dioscorea alata TaxID=55571 RepID=A0ACB7WDW7_DIOAL|nr:NTF2-like protein [Dioscorea alata]
MSRVLPITDIAGGIPRPSTTSRSRPFIFGMLKGHETKVSRVSDTIRGAGISPLISSPMLRVSSPPSLSPSLMEQRQRDGDEDKRDYYLNMGYAIRTIREELPEIFYREPNFDIYREDIIFKDPLNTFVGIDNYKLIFGALRFCGQLFFKVLWVDIVSIWQPIENIIMIRWTVHGIARVPWESRGRFDGTSEYKLDRNGKIFEHKVDNVAINSPPKFRVFAVEEMIQSLGCPSTPKPTFFEAKSSSVYSYVPTVLRNSLARVYLAVCLILFCQCTSKG